MQVLKVSFLSKVCFCLPKERKIHNFSSPQCKQTSVAQKLKCVWRIFKLPMNRRTQWYSTLFCPFERQFTDQQCLLCILIYLHVQLFNAALHGLKSWNLVSPLFYPCKQQRNSATNFGKCLYIDSFGHI